MKILISLNIKRKILFFFTIATLIISGSLCAYINFVVKPNDIENTKFTIAHTVESKSTEVGLWINKKAVEYRIISAIPAFTSMDIREITPLIDRFTSLYVRNGETMETFSYIGKNGFCWINSEATENLMDYNDYKTAYDSDREFIIGKPVVNKNNREVMLFYYPVLGYENQKEALICSAVPTVGLKQIIDSSQIYNGKTWVMNSNHNLLTTNEEYFYNNYLSKRDIENIKLESLSSSGEIELINTNGEVCTLFYSPVNQYDDWVVCTLVNNAELSAAADNMLAGIILLLIFLLIITLFIGVFLTRSVMEPIDNLRKCMKEVEHGNLSSYYDTTLAKDEIYELGLTYNKMLDHISKLIEQIYKEQSEKRSAELAALQAQIKPHFLYNTLDNIKWMAKDQGAEDVAKIITSLSTFFRTSLSNGQEFITLKEEIKHTKSYLDIQAIKYREKVRYNIYLDENIKNILIAKIILQPLVENSINHGIRPKDSIGTISISCSLYSNNLNKYIKITVEDNGVGMSESELANLRNNLEELNNSKSFGMINTLRRLRSFYGEDVIFEVESKENVGTKINILLPYMEDKNV